LPLRVKTLLQKGNLIAGWYRQRMRVKTQQTMSWAKLLLDQHQNRITPLQPCLKAVLQSNQT